MQNIILIILTLCGGIAMTVQPSINARLAEKTGLIESALVSFFVGTVILAVISVTAGGGSLKGIASCRWWEMTGGIYGAFFVTVITLAVPRIGTLAAMAIIIATQLATGIILDHFGLFGFKATPVDIKRLSGAALLIIGALLVIKN